MARGEVMPCGRGQLIQVASLGMEKAGHPPSPGATQHKPKGFFAYFILFYFFLRRHWRKIKARGCSPLNTHDKAEQGLTHDSTFGVLTTTLNQHFAG